MGTAIGMWMSCFMGGMALGPLVGGMLLERFWWGSAFLLGVPFMALLLVVGPVLLPEYRDESVSRLDLSPAVAQERGVTKFDAAVTPRRQVPGIP